MTLPAKVTNFFRKSRTNKLIAGGIALVVVVAGIAFVTIQAAGFFVATEAEKGTLTANAKAESDPNASAGAAIKFTAPVVTPSTGTCAVATQHVPDGPDGMGGCWPGPSNTGPNALEADMARYDGPCTITASNTVIDSKVVHCATLLIAAGANNVLIKNSYVLGGVIQKDENATSSFTIEDSQIDNAQAYPACSNGSCQAGPYACGSPVNQTTECGVGYRNYTILRTEIINTNRAAYCQRSCTIQDSYLHGTKLWPDASNAAHASSVRNEQYLTLRHTSLGCDFTGPFANPELGCSADMSGYPDFAPIMHATIDSNLFLANNVGAGFCAYGGGTSGKPYSNDPNNATYIVFKNNVFQRGANGKCGTWGAITDFKPGRTGNQWVNNKWNDGTVVDPA